MKRFSFGHGISFAVSSICQQARSVAGTEKYRRHALWMVLAACVLLPSGCMSQRGRMASKHQVNTTQLLAAARQYEKEGQAVQAAHVYKHVLTYHPGHQEAKEGLAMVQQGKLRVNQDFDRLMATTDPTIRSNPQARELLAKQQNAQRDQVSDQMTQMITAAAANAKVIESDAAPTRAMLAYAKAKSERTLSAETELTRNTEAVVAQTAIGKAVVAQADAVLPVAEQIPVDQIEPTAFELAEQMPEIAEEPPADWSTETPWKQHSLTHLCNDANAAVLNEVAKLDSDNDDIRKDGLTQLALMGPQAASAAPAIRRMLDDNNQMVQVHAAWAAWETEGDSFTAITPLHTLLDSDSSEVVQFAAYTLGNIGQPALSTAGKLRQLLSSRDSIIKLHAAEALTRIAAPADRGEATDTLIVLLKDDDADVRSLAAMTLGELDELNAEAAIFSLTAALDDSDARVRTAAALSLGAYGPAAQPAIAKLTQKAQSDRTDVREAAQAALACIQL